MHTTHSLLHELVHAHHGAAHSSRFELPVPGMTERLDTVVLLGVDEHVVERSFLQTSGTANAAVGAFAEILLRHTKCGKQSGNLWSSIDIAVVLQGQSSGEEYVAYDRIVSLMGRDSSTPKCSLSYRSRPPLRNRHEAMKKIMIEDLAQERL